MILTKGACVPRVSMKHKAHDEITSNSTADAIARSDLKPLDVAEKQLVGDGTEENKTKNRRVEWIKFEGYN